MGLFGLFEKKSDGSQCPYCDAKDITPVDKDQSETKGAVKYICNYCGKTFTVKLKK